MKIIFILPTLKKGGAERLVLDILRQCILQNDIEIKLIIFRNEIEYLIEDITEYISIIPSSVSLSLKRKPLTNVEKLHNFIKEFQPDIIHSHLFEAELVSRYCFYPKAQWFSHIHDNMLQFNNFSIKSFTNKQALTNYYEKRVLFKNYLKNGGTHFIAISKHTESYINSVQSKYPVALLYNAIDVKRFQKPTHFQKSTSNLNLSNEGEHSDLSLNPQSQLSTLNLINIGSFVPKKNQTFLLDIILELNKKGVHTSCVFLGNGPQKTEVQNRAKELGISNQCQFLGNIENVEKYLWQSDVYVHTATYEPLGLVLLEAMAASIPVITLDGGGNRDIMKNGKTGFLIEKQNPKEFSDRIIEVYQNKEISDFNLEFAKQFDIESYCEKLLNLYKQELCVKSNPSFCQQSPSTIYD